MRRRTRIGAIATAGLVSLALWAPTTATADITEPFTGSATGELLHANLLDLAALTEDAPTILEARLSTTEADADNTPGAVATRGYGRNLFVALAGEEIPIDLSTAEQTAPPDNTEPESVTLVDLSQADPLLTGGISTSTALARDPAALECPDEGRTTVSEGTSTTSDLGVLNLESFMPGAGSLISVTDGTGSGTLESSSGVYVGTSGEVIAESNAPAVQLDVAGELTLEVVDPTLTATATGVPGTASVEYTGQVLLNGDELVGTSSQTLSLTVLEPLLAPVDQLILNEVAGPLDDVLTQLLGPVGEVVASLPPPLNEVLNFSDLPDDVIQQLIQDADLVLEDLASLLSPTVDISVAQLNSSVAPDGTSASGSIDVVSIDLTLVSTLAGTTTPIVAVDVMPLTASATVPAGGIDCGGPPAISVDKGGPDTAEPGETFDYTIDVTNDTGCDATDVVVTDTITGPDGFEIVGTDPEADSVEDGVVTWEVGDLANGESRTFTVSVTVPEDATDGEEFVDTATTDGNCDGQALPRGEDTLDGPSVAGGDIEDVEQQSLPRTGGGLALLGLGAVVVASRLRRR